VHGKSRSAFAWHPTGETRLAEALFHVKHGQPENAKNLP